MDYQQCAVRRRKSSTSLALSVVVHSGLDGPYCEEGTVGGAAAGEAVKQKGDSGEQTARVLFGEAVKQNGDLADHAAREFMDEAAKQKVILVNMRLVSTLKLP